MLLEAVRSRTRCTYVRQPASGRTPTRGHAVAGTAPCCPPTTTIRLSVEHVGSREEDGKYTIRFLGAMQTDSLSGGTSPCPELQPYNSRPIALSHLAHCRSPCALRLIKRPNTTCVSNTDALSASRRKSALNTSVSNTDTPTVRLAKALSPTTSTLVTHCPVAQIVRYKPSVHTVNGNRAGPVPQIGLQEEIPGPRAARTGGCRATPTHSSKSTPRGSWSLR